MFPSTMKQSLLSKVRKYVTISLTNAMEISVPCRRWHSSNSGDLARSSKPRKRSRRRLLEDANVPSYKEFVHRHTVLSMYRQYFVALRSMSPEKSADLTDQVRKEFKSHLHDADPFNIQRALTEGSRRLKELQMLSGQTAKSTNDADSWMNIPDKEDPRGRIGTGWPWQKTGTK